MHSSRKLCAVLLVVVMVCGLLPTSFGVGTEGLKHLKGTNQATENYLTAFAAEPITVDGLLSEGGWTLSNNVIEETSKTLKATFGAQWDNDNLYLAVNFLDCNSINLTIAGKALTVAAAGTATGDVAPAAIAAGTDKKNRLVVEMKIPFEALGISERTVDTTVSFTAAVGTASLSGIMTLSDIDWIFAANEYNTIDRNASDYVANTGFGWSDTTGGSLYDRFNAEGGNLDVTRTFVSFFAPPYGSNDYSPLDDHTVTSYTQFDVHIDKMPVLTQTQAKNISDTRATFCVNGFSAAVSDARKDGYSNIVRFGIYNSADGLMFACLKSDGSYDVKELQREIGDTITIGVEWHENLSATFYIDGEQIGTYTNATVNLGWVMQQGVRFELNRNSAAQSAEDDMEVTVTNVAVGKRVDTRPVSGDSEPSPCTNVRTSFLSGDILVDGVLDEHGWLMNQKIGDAGDFGAKWQKETLMLAMETGNASTLTVTINNKTMVLNLADLTATGDFNPVKIAKNDATVEMKLAMADLGVTADTGVKIPVTLKLNDAEFQGTLELIDIDWFAAENKTHPLDAVSGADYADSFRNSSKVDGGWRMFNLYDAAEGPVKGDIYFTLRAQSNDLYLPLYDHTVATYAEADIRIDDMPVLTAEQAADCNSAYACTGLTLSFYDKYDSDYNSNVALLGIYNTAEGLVLTGRYADGTSQAVPLDKELGETFRLGLLWNTNGDVEVWLNGESFHTFAGLERTLRWYGQGSFIVHLIDRPEGVQSEDESMDATVTNIALGKQVNPDEANQGGVRQKNYLTAFSAESVMVDGLLAESGWTLSNRIVEENSQTLKATFGTQWDDENLYLAVNYLDCTSVDLTIAGKALSVTSAGVATGDFTPTEIKTGADKANRPVVEMKIPFEKLGIYVRTVGTNVPFTAVAGTAELNGIMTLSDVGWSFATNEYNTIERSSYDNSPNDGNRGFGWSETTGCYLWDRYNTASTANETRLYNAFFAPPNGINNFSPLDDHSVTSYTQFDVCIEQMPMLTKERALATVGGNATFAVNGFSFEMSDNRISGYSNVLRFGIYNSTDGLIFVCMKEDGSKEVKELDRKIGDTITLGIEWHEDLSATVYVDGEVFGTYSNPAKNLGWIMQAGIRFELMRASAAQSADDNMEVKVTNVAVGQKIDMSKYLTTPASPARILSAYTAEAVAVDGSLADEGWLLNINVLDENNILKGKAGSQWDENKLYLAIDLRSAESAQLTVNEKNLTVDNHGSVTTQLTGITTTANDGVVEIAIPLSQLGVVLYDYGTEIPISIAFGTGSYSGTIFLSEIDWFMAENKEHPVTITDKGSTALGSQPANENQGVVAIEDGWQMFDLYNAAGENVSNIRTYLQGADTKFTAAVNDKTVMKHLEFDLNVRSMPIYTTAEATGWSQAHSNYGFTWILADQYMDDYWSNCLSFGIFNSPNGLVLTAMRNGIEQAFVPLNRQVGDCIRIGTDWELDGSVLLYVDGKLVTNIEKGATQLRWFAQNAYLFNLLRSTKAPEGPEDSMMVEITNIALGTCTQHSIFDSLTFDTIKGENTDPNAIASDLELPETLEGRDLTWESSKPDVISENGKVSTPETIGEKITLTASLEDGTSKTFELIVTGTGAVAGDVLVVERDYNPAFGQGKNLLAFQFTLDTDNNSIVYDMQNRLPVNVVELKDSDNTSRLNKEVLSLWISDDNVTYTRVKDFKLLQSGSTWYLYDFDVQARYVKVHCTHFEGDDADFIGVPETMIRAYHEDQFGANGGTFEETSVSVTNDQASDQRDAAWKLEGVSAQRVLLNGQLLYHYVEDGNTIVRIPYLAAGESVTLTVLSGNESALDISNKEYVHEVTYGTREAWETERRMWVQTLNDGTVVGISGLGNGRKGICFSHDGGHTWSEYEAIEATVDWITADNGGFIYDTHTGRLIFYGMRAGETENDLTVNFIYSDDGGHSWQKAGGLQSDKSYNITYTQGLVLSCYDGENGPNVDFVVPIAAAAGDKSSTLCTTGAYSTDGGLTWQTSKTWIFYNKEHSGFEEGVSEATIMEREDGTLVLYARNQFATEIHFAKSYSYDHGITWDEQATLTNVYTTNTQPIFYNYNNAELLTWGGNNCLGGGSYIRTPFSIGVTNDGGENFRNIQDLYVKYSLQGLTVNTMNRITNQVVTKVGNDSLLLTWWNRTDRNTRNSNILMRVDDFTDYFYNTKGVYDSFEHGTVKYEGWDTIVGTAGVSADQHSDGAASMKLDSGIVSRSIPYVQKGSVALDLYVSGSANLKLDLQSAFTDKHAFCAPIGINVANNAIAFIGAEAASGLSLQSGWNTLVFDFDLANGVATFSVNGSDAVNMPVNLEIGDYICFLTLNSNSTVYVDNVLVVDNDPPITPEPAADPVDKSELEAAVDEAEALNEEDYTEETWTELAEALETANGIAADKNATQAQVDAAAKALNAAIEALEKKSEDKGAACIGDKYYDTLEEAVENVKDGETIDLLRDYDGSRITVDRKVNFSVRTNGFDFDSAAVVSGNGYKCAVSEGETKDTVAYTFTRKSSPGTNVPDDNHQPEQPAASRKDDCNGTAANGCPSASFIDVDPTKWYHHAVDYAVESGLMNGVGENKFNPNGKLSRAMMWTILARLDGVDTSGGAVWYEKGQKWAMEKGVSDGTDPNGSITREQLVTMLWRYVGEPKAEGNLNGFIDADEVSSWALEAMQWAVGAGVIHGDGAKLNPRGQATRAEVAQIFKNYFE